MSFEFNEFKKYAKSLEKLEKEFDGFIKRFLLEMGLRALRETKKNHTNPVVTVDTGLMRASWQLKEITRKGNMLEITIYNPVEYADFVEYGHLNRSRTKWIEGRFMVTRAIDTIQSQIPAKCREMFVKWLKELGV